MTEEKKGLFGRMLGGGKTDQTSGSTEAEGSQGKGFFAKVRDRLTKTKTSLVSQTLSIFHRRGKIDEELLEEMEECLISADVGVNVSMYLVEEIRDRSKREKREQGEDFEWLRKTFHDLVLAEIGTEAEGLNLGEGINVILVVGVNGVGKTTTIGKLANRLRQEGRKVVVAAGDTFRAAAIDQLKIWAERSGAEIIAGEDGGDPAAVVFNAIQKAQTLGDATVIVDTAGRLHNKANLMKELEKIGRIISREAEGAPQETLLVLDASTGQNGLTQAKVFKEIVPLTGIVLTKLDGTAKGGVTLSVRRELGLPVKFIGLGEGMDDLEPFDPKNFVDGLFTESRPAGE